MNKFTPGPWETAKHESESYGSLDACHFAIFSAGTKKQPAYQIATTMGDGVYLREQEQANANLIAAAPEMHNLLNAALACINSPQSFNVDELITDIQNVLRKAQGGAQ